MSKRNTILMAAPLVGMLCSPAWSVAMEDLSRCYTRTYTAEHLHRQPKQNVKTLALNIDAKGGAVTLSGTNREGDFGYLWFSCYENTGSATLSPSCATFEADSQLWIEARGDGSIVIKSRNTFLSDIGEEINYVDDPENYQMFYLEEANHSYIIGTGPFFHHRLYPAVAGACPKVD